jgi:hypothetical protein
VLGYYQVTGFPMFTINFGGSIGKHKVRVYDTSIDDSNGTRGGTQRALQFGSPGNSSGDTRTGVLEVGSSRSPSHVTPLPPLHPRAPLLSDSNVNLDWLGEFAEFIPNGSNLSSPDSFLGEPYSTINLYNSNLLCLCSLLLEDSSYSIVRLLSLVPGDPLAELGIYNADKDVSD